MTARSLVAELKAFRLKEPLTLGAFEYGKSVVNIVIYKDGVEAASLKCEILGKVLKFSTGVTVEAYRRQGLGTRLRALVVWCAKRAGFKEIRQLSTRFANTPNTPRPTSAYIMNKLGFRGGIDPNINAEQRFFMLNTNNISKVNAIVRLLS
jgi:GNAT superfamily N-acetyltransferase